MCDCSLRRFAMRPRIGSGVSKTKRAYKPDSVPRVNGAAVIYLGPPLPKGSCGRPEDAAGPAAAPAYRGVSPYLALLRVGFASIPIRTGTWCALTAPFHPCLCPAGRTIGGVVSVALSVASRRLGVTQHPALWSPDFPPRCRGGRPALLAPPVYAPPGTLRDDLHAAVGDHDSRYKRLERVPPLGHIDVLP